MAKISELVKTYRLLNDPNAPDWNVKFVGAVVLALGAVAAASAALWFASADELRPAAAAPEATAPAPPRECTPQEVAAAVAEGAAPRPGDTLASGCAVASAAA